VHNIATLTAVAIATPTFFMTFLQLFCFDFLRIFTSFAFDPFDPSQLGHVEHSAFATAASLLPIKLDVVPLRHGFDELEGQ